MVYKEMFVIAIKSQGKVLREQGEKVLIPFGQEYSIFMKNLSGKRVCVSVDIDGQDVLDRTNLMISPNEFFDLEGFLKGSQVSNKFKFIEKTQEISDFRGDKAEDGLIRVQYRFEKINPPIQQVPYKKWEYDPYHPTHPWNPYHPLDKGPVWKQNDYEVTCDNLGEAPSSSSSNSQSASFSALRGLKSPENYSAQIKTKGGISGQSANMNYTSNSLDLNDKGITVKGSESNQKFRMIDPISLETEINTIIIQLIGSDKLVTVQDKIQCETCGKKNKSSSKFCSKCGTALF